jgi:hypothetical protein
MFGMISFIFLSQLGGCDRNAKDLVPMPSDAYPGIIEIGELEVVEADTLNQLIGQEQGTLTHIEPVLDAAGNTLMSELYPDGAVRPYYYGQLGQAETGKQGGASFTFTGTGGEVCLIVDPETVFWSRSIKEGPGLEPKFAYPDFYNDDGDLDLFAGMSSYYTGSPGLEIGDFTGFYTDSQGQLIEIQYGECTQNGSSMSGITNAHAGRGTVEFCTIDTDQKEGIEYTVVIETFNVPLDDGVLSFGVAVVNERCARLDTSECFIRGESFCSEDDPDCKTGLNGKTRSCTDKIEAAQCEGMLGTFCCANPEMCGPEDNETDAFCENAYELLGDDGEPVKTDRDGWCEGTGLCCENGEVDVSGSTSGGGGGTPPF